MLSSFPQEKLDPRVKRTRELIQRSFMEIIDEKGFTSISVQDITARAGINRATFYAHYTDKFDLLDKAIGEMFRAEIERRMLNVCEFQVDNLRSLVVTVCEFVGKIHTHTDHEEQYQILAEAQIRNQVFGLILHWLEKIETIRNCSVSGSGLPRQQAGRFTAWPTNGHTKKGYPPPKHLPMKSCRSLPLTLGKRSSLQDKIVSCVDLF